MKERLFVIGIAACMLVFGAGIVCAQQTVSLDNAISNAAEEFSYNLKKGSKVAIVSIRADASRMSNYLIEELNLTITRQRMFTVIDRVQIEGVQRDFNFRISEDVSDATAQAIGKRLGAQAVITGSFESLGSYYRFRVRAIEVDTAAVAAVYSANVQNDSAVASLMGVGGAPVASAPAPAASAPAPVASVDYDSFTEGERWGTWALNAFIPLGLGSYVVMQDAVGGTLQLLTGAGGWTLLIIGISNVKGFVREDPKEDDYGNYEDNRSPRPVTGVVCLILGGSLLVTKFIHNIARSASYNKPRPRVGSIADPDAWSVAVVPGEKGVERVSLAYTVRY